MKTILRNLVWLFVLAVTSKSAFGLSANSYITGDASAVWGCSWTTVDWSGWYDAFISAVAVESTLVSDSSYIDSAFDDWEYPTALACPATYYSPEPGNYYIEGDHSVLMDTGEGGSWYELGWTEDGPIQVLGDCVLPDYETSVFSEDWVVGPPPANAPYYAAIFDAFPVDAHGDPPTSFVGRTVQEAWAGGDANETCYHHYDLTSVVTSSGLVLGLGYYTDMTGLAKDEVVGSTRPCGYHVYQDMSMACSDGTFYWYQTNYDTATYNSTNMVITRDDATVTYGYF